MLDYSIFRQWLLPGVEIGLNPFSSPIMHHVTLLIDLHFYSYIIRASCGGQLVFKLNDAYCAILNDVLAFID